MTVEPPRKARKRGLRQGKLEAMMAVQISTVVLEGDTGRCQRILLQSTGYSRAHHVPYCYFRTVVQKVPIRTITGEIGDFHQSSCRGAVKKERQWWASHVIEQEEKQNLQYAQG